MWHPVTITTLTGAKLPKSDRKFDFSAASCFLFQAGSDVGLAASDVKLISLELGTFDLIGSLDTFLRICSRL